MPDVAFFRLREHIKDTARATFKKTHFAMDPKKERERQLTKRRQKKYYEKKKARLEYQQQENIELKKRLEELLKVSDHFKRQFPEHWQAVQPILGEETAQQPTQELCRDSNVMTVEPFLHQESVEQQMVSGTFFDEDLFSDLLADVNSFCEDLPDLF